MSLADELLADLEGGGDDGLSDIGEEPELEESKSIIGGSNTLANGRNGEGGRGGIIPGNDEDEDMDTEIKAEEEPVLPPGGVRPVDELDEETVKGMDLGSVDEVGNVAKLMGSRMMKDVLQKIDRYRTQDPSQSGLGQTDESLEYKLIVQANNIAVEIDNEILIVHKFTRDHYYPRFPDLESLVYAPLDYCRAVHALGNAPDSETLSHVDLTGILPSATIMVVTVTAATTSGKPLSPQQWKVVQRACEMAEELDAAKRKIIEYVESRMSFLAPNLSAIVGTRTATKLLGVAGGLHALSRMPSANVFLLGSQRKTPAGYSTGSHSVMRKHTGFIYQSEVVQSAPEELRMKAQRTTAAKCVLAARMDVAGEHKDGSYGNKLLEDVEKRLDKLAEPPPPKLVKALPVPIEGSKRRRGGKRARRAKEAYSQSELGKLRNRMKFGEEEEEVGAFDETKGMGMIGSASNRIRAGAGEKRTAAKMSKANKNRLGALRGQSASTSGTATSGLASSLVFTPVQGLELVDPSAQQKKIDEANARWFAEGAFSVVPGKGNKTVVPKTG